MGQGLSLTSRAQGGSTGVSGCVWQPWGPTSMALESPLNMGLGRCQALLSGSLPALPALALCSPASPLRTPHQPLLLSRAHDLGHFPSILLRLPSFCCSSPALSLASLLLPSSHGLEQRTPGKLRHMGPSQERALPGALSSPKRTSYVAQERAATPPGDRNGLST